MGPSIYQISTKLECIQKPFRQKNKKHFGDVKKMFAVATDKLSNIQTQIQQCPDNRDLCELEKVALDEFHLWKHRQESFYIQRSKKG